MALPNTQALNSTTFRVPPLAEGKCSIPDLYDWHLDNSPDHPLFIYEDPTHLAGLRTICWREAIQGIHRASQYIGSRVTETKSTNAPTVVAILALSDTITYFCTIIGALRAGITIFPISPRNSPAAIASLLARTNTEYLLFSSEPVIRDLFTASLAALAELKPGAPVQVHAMPVFGELFPDGGYNPQFPRLPRVELDMDAPGLILHSSGSTAFPKPIAWSHRRLLQLAEIPFYGDLDLTGLLVGCHSMPMFHGMGIAQIGLAVSSGIVAAVFKPTSPATIPNPINVIEAAIATHCDLVFCAPAFIEAWSRRPEYVEYMSSMRGVGYGGGPLTKEVGDFLTARGVDIHVQYGCTECGVMNAFIPNSRGSDWDYFAFSNQCKPHFIPDGQGTFEVVIMSTERHKPLVTNTRINGIDGYATSDLLVPHPTKPGLWKIFGRVDDQIMLSTGEKTNPGPLESILNRDPHIQATVIFGRGRFQNGVLVDPKSEFVFDANDKGKLVAFRNAIWPSVERLNTFAPSHSRIFKEMIIVASPSKPFTYTAKQTARRQAVLEDYEEEIEVLYRAVDESAQTDLEAPQIWDISSTLQFVRTVVAHTVHKTVSDDDDLFQHGCDSLQATWIRNSLIRAILLSSPDKARLLSTGFVYQHPTIASLATFISHAVQGTTARNPSENTTSKVAQMLLLVNKYATSFPEREPPSHQHFADDAACGDCVLVTGTTGSFGANILAQLITSPTVRRIYALNRSSKDGQDLRQKQQAASVKAGFKNDSADNSKVVLIEGDLSKADFAIDHSLLTEIRSSVTHIIHNAWRVDFNLSLSSFEPDIQGVRNLVDLALQSTRPESPRLLFVSSIGVFRNTKLRGPATEVHIDDPSVAVSSGYSEAKWVAERIFQIAAQKTPLRPIVVRAGQLTGGPSGAWNDHEWFPSLVKSGVVLGCLPDVDGTISWISSLSAATALIEMRNSESDVLHLVHPKPTTWHSIIGDISRALDVPLVSYSTWLSALERSSYASSKDEVQAMRDNPALRLLDFYRAVAACNEDVEPLGVRKLATDRSVKVSSTLGDPNLAQIGTRDVEKWLNHWAKVGFSSEL